MNKYKLITYGILEFVVGILLSVGLFLLMDWFSNENNPTNRIFIIFLGVWGLFYVYFILYLSLLIIKSSRCSENDF